ncbi:hypothetical protein DYB28_015387, partial [Aphanomyces astaci]
MRCTANRKVGADKKEFLIVDSCQSAVALHPAVEAYATISLSLIRVNDCAYFHFHTRSPPPMLHLRRPTWTSTQRQHVRESATQALRQFIFDSQLLHNDGGSIEWTLDGSTDKGGLVQLYTGKTPFNVVVFANARRVRGTLAQAATLADQFPTSHHFDALESVAVASLDEDDSATDNHHHHVGVTWMAVKAAPSAKVRDACVLEVRDMFETGEAKGFASLVQSIDVCPEATGFVRMHIQHTGYTFTEVSPGLLDVVCCMHVDFRGTLPSWVAR